MSRSFYDPSAAGAATTGQLDYFKQPLPLFGVFSNYSNSTYGLNVYDSDLQLVTGSGGNFQPFNGEFANNFGYTQTQSSVASSSLGSSWVKSTTNCGVDGNSVLSVGYDGMFTPRAGDPQGIQGYFGVVIGPEGYRQSFSLYNAGVTLRQCARGLPIVFDSTSLTGKYTPAATTNGPSAIALVGYNRNLGTLVWLEPTSTTGASYRVHTWKHPKRKLTGRPGELNAITAEAFQGTNGASYSYYDVNSAYGAASNTEVAYSGRVMPTNDGRIAFTRMYPGSAHQYQVFAPPAANSSTPTQGTATAKSAIGLTTSYGRDQGTQYGIRHQISWDNKWIVPFCPYYYFGAGMMAFFISVDNPDLWYSYQNSQTDGVQVLPRGRSGFALCSSSNNADSGVGLTLGNLDFGGGLVNGQTTAVTGANVTPQFFSGYFETAYTSTQYPCIVGVERWYGAVTVQTNDQVA